MIRPPPPDEDEWHKEQERRHRENILQFKKIEESLDWLREMAHQNRVSIIENTQLTQAIAAKVEELKPLVLATRAVKKTGSFAQSAANFGKKAGQVVAFFVGLFAIFIALFHGERWAEAWRLFLGLLK